MDDLINYLSNQKLKPKSWVESLEERKKEELEFHNFDRETEDVKIVEEQKNIHHNRKFYSINLSQKKYVNKWLEKNLKNKVFLDYACGNGAKTIQASKLGAKIAIGIDISDVSVVNAAKKAESLDMGNCYFLQADCEDTELPDESIDVILCSGMLHHLDLEIAFPELQRILKKNGKILCVEALSVNPLIQYYRESTPEMRTEWEKAHILGPRDLKFASKFFRVTDTKYWYLLTLKLPLYAGIVTISPSYNSSHPYSTLHSLFLFVIGNLT